MRLGRLGTFPKRGPARVLWLGAESDAPGHADLVRRLECELAALGFAGDGDSSARKGADGPSAHITLARVKHLEAGKSAVREISKNNSKTADIRAVFFVYNIVLVESELRPTGSVYSILETFPLNTAGNQIDPSPPAAA
jgi:2'-5' RNA ligase